MVQDPVFQANFWLRLLDDREAEKLNGKTFAEKIKAIHALCGYRGDTLVLRNWAYLDFFAAPFTQAVTNKLATIEALNKHFNFRQIVTVRHPMDQWLSWQHYQGVADSSSHTFSEFIDACHNFKWQTSGIPFVRYEDFVEKPQAVMQKICCTLDLNYDPVFQDRWPYYHQITGDDNDRISGNWTISPKPKRRPEAALLKESEANNKYRDLLNFYKYTGQC